MKPFRTIGKALFFTSVLMSNHPSIFRERRARIMLYVLVLYVIFQLVWWGILLIENYREIYLLNNAWPEDIKEAMLRKKIWMLIGEGSVFLILVFIGFRYLNRSISRELQLARMQKTFLLSVTHELKTPISAIKLFLDTLKTRRLTEEQTTALLNDALKETKRLQVLSENILLTQRIEGQAEEMLSEKIDFSSMLQSEVKRYGDVFDRRVVLEIDDHLMVRGDRHLLQSLCSNLLENAVKYSSTNTDIQVFCRRKNNEITFEIKDNGIGIPEEEKPHIFKKFYRVGNEETRSHKGTGLGLYIVSNVVRLHQGSIFVSDNKPTGTVITVVFKNIVLDEKQ